MRPGTFIRLLINVLLLIVVWQNAHWSVATLLTLISATRELENYISFRIAEEATDELQLLTERMRSASKTKTNQSN